MVAGRRRLLSVWTRRSDSTGCTRRAYRAARWRDHRSSPTLARAELETRTSPTPAAALRRSNLTAHTALETRRLKDWNFVRFKQPYLLQTSTTQSMLLDPCDMENQYLSRWRAAGGTPLFPRVQHKHHTPVSSVKRAHSSRQLWGPDAVTGAGMRRRSRRRRSRAQLTSEIEEWRRVSWGQLSAPRSRQRAQDFKRARRGSFPDLAEQLSRLRFQ